MSGLSSTPDVDGETLDALVRRRATVEMTDSVLDRSRIRRSDPRVIAALQPASIPKAGSPPGATTSAAKGSLVSWSLVAMFVLIAIASVLLWMI